LQQPVADPMPAAARESTAVHLPYLPGLDGLRALAVLAVLFYHAGLRLDGGYLGVEAFFVLSGFLITALLWQDWHANGRINLKAFWLRRARRLLPALFVLLLGTLLLTAVLLPAELGTLLRDTLAALGYVTNWYLIASGQPYFDAVERPPLLQHLWSLAIEEQFYLLWPLLCAAGLHLLGHRGLLGFTLVATLASAGLMAALYEPGAEPSRLYYGTDTRAAGLLLGSALALALTPGNLSGPARRGLGTALDIAGFLALAGLLAAFVLLHEQHPLLYRGGFALVALATAIVVACTTNPAARLLPWLLERQPLRWIGLRSYGIYLWHWPIFMLTRPGVDAPDTWYVQLLRFGLAIGVAALSYTLVEQPARRGALGRLWRVPRTRWALPLATGALVLVAGVVAGASQAALPRTQAVSPTIAAGDTSAAPARTPDDGSGAPLPAATNQPAGQTTPVSTHAAGPPIDATLAAELQRILDDTVADGTIPGAVLSVRLGDGTTWSGASGVADRDAGAAMQTATRLRVGSLSKMFTAVVVMQLVEEGAIELDAPVSTWLPDLLPNGDAVTVRQLLQHTSGLYDYLEDRRFVAQAYEEPERIWEPRELVEYATEFPPSFAPGAENSWDYSSTNYVVLGMIVEEVTGRSLAEELRERVLTPLALEATFSVPQERVSGPQARGYSKSDDQTEVAMSFAYGSANIVTTADDLRLFGDALFAGQLLEPETLAQMEEFVDGKGRYNMPALAYGLGLMRNRLPISAGPDDQPRPPAASRVVGHIGGFGGFRAALWFAPESGTLVALGMNQASTDPNTLATAVFDAILAYQGR
jgi:peptidoglycan/LPS O-acetylase OafA/YrhL/CubicO group peptidase (beta-lactamase class C family)